jgi:geranylgeranyl diphosphate synthase, type II
LTTLASESLVRVIEEKLDTLFSERVCGAELFEAVRYALLSPGKRLRPLITLAIVTDFKGSMEKALLPACALELIHTYSLIHDDLPCMDDDDWRRGKPSLHKVYGEGRALLVGDLLLTYAFQLLAESPGLSSEERITLIRTLTHRIGPQGMIGGQAADLFNQKIDWPTLQSIHLNKTAALISAACEFGGILSALSVETMTLLKEIGTNLGIAFQIIDDLLDHVKERGKMTNTLSHLTLKEAKAHIDTLFSSALTAIDSLPSAPLLKQLSHQLISCKVNV